jgi:hypothetical protein
MPKVWYAVPSARPVAEAQACFDAWRDMGYATAATRKRPDLNVDRLACLPEYPGLWVATNYLAKLVLDEDPECQIVVTGGDDVWPDTTKRADQIADEFVAHFRGTLGVMQPTKDLPPGHSGLAWSPWFGREWCRRAFGGRGPAEPAFWHYYGDLAIAQAAWRHDVWWERPDLKHTHRNWKELRVPRPPHLAEARDRWQADKDLYTRLAAAGFPNTGLMP